MKRCRYKWTKAYRVDPQVAGEIFQKCTNDSEVVALAKEPGHPLHDTFDWDDTTAANSHRLHQAREMRCSLQVEIIVVDKKPVHVRAFLRNADKTGYVLTTEATPEELGAAEQLCWLQMTAFRTRWKNLQFAREVIEAIADKDKQVQRNVRRRHG